MLQFPMDEYLDESKVLLVLDLNKEEEEGTIVERY